MIHILAETTVDGAAIKILPILLIVTTLILVGSKSDKHDVAHHGLKFLFAAILIFGAGAWMGVAKGLAAPTADWVAAWAQAALSATRPG